MELKLIQGVSDVGIRNEPFPLFGRMIPVYDGASWSYREDLWSAEQISEMCFPEEDYNPSESSKTFVGAFDGDRCIGLAVLDDAWFKYMYLDDLKVLRAYRRQGVGAQLVEKCMELALNRGYHGLYVIGQDNNLAACRFYLKNGFKIGGFDNRIYEGTSQEDKANIIFYRKAAR